MAIISPCLGGLMQFSWVVAILLGPGTMNFLKGGSSRTTTKKGGSGDMDRDERPLSEDSSNKNDDDDDATPSASARSGAAAGSAPSTYKLYHHSLDDGMEDAEDAILSNLEAQARRTRTLSDGFRPAIPGERAPLGVDSLGTAWSDAQDDEDSDSRLRRTTPSSASPTPTPPLQTTTTSTARPTFHQMASSRSWRHPRRGSIQEGSRMAHILLASIDEVGNYQNDVSSIRQNEQAGHELFTSFNSDLFSADKRPQDHHEGLAFLWNKDQEGTTMRVAHTTAASQHQSTPLERQPLLGGKSGSDDGAARNDNLKHHETSGIRMERRRPPTQGRATAEFRTTKRLLNCLNPVKMLKRIIHILLHRTFVISIPCFVIAWILFFFVGNPKLDFMPGTATISWWLNFFGRQLLVFEIASFTEFILIDIMVMSSKAVVQMLGPWVTIFCLQSKGWPFLVTFWGLYDMILLHGDNDFQRHWLYWTGIQIYSQANSGSYILSSSTYLRVLMGMELAGVAATLKRTLLTLYFGKRNFDIYKPKLEDILQDIIVITEIAELGAEADTLPDDGELLMDTKELVEDNIEGRSRVGIVRWSSVKFNDTDRADSDDGVMLELDSTMYASPVGDETKKTAAEGPHDVRSQMPSTVYKSGTSGLIKIKNLLDRWDEPVNKLDKTTESSVNDLLKFRKALTYMDLEHPFGEVFGPASTRDELIKSAQVLYQRLLKLSPGSHHLPYSVLSVLSENVDGTVDMTMKKSIGNLFRADANGEIPILAFIQNCDVVYRRLRYFRASVGNSSVIDKVLENIIDGFFAFGLTVVILSLLNFDPWPLLVSVSTLLVSLAFAIGPTAAKTIEGIILIAGTRPFDIGDRIIIANTPGQPTAGVTDSWFVEDITLFSTTLRLAATNEVAIVSNGTISGTRITNCARSKNAVVSIMMKLHISLHDGHNAHKFKEALENYINDNPAVWDSLVNLRCEDINSDDEYVMYHLAVRSRQSWQVAGRILSERGRLHQFCTDLAKQLKVNFDSPTSRRVFYYGGTLVDGAVKDFKKDLLMDRNNISMGGPDDFLGSRRNLDHGRRATVPRDSSNEEADGEGTMPSTDNVVDDIFLAMVNQSHE